MERALIAELIETIDTVLKHLNSNNIKQAIEIIELALNVKGFGHIKEKNYQAYQHTLKQKLKIYQSGQILAYEVAA